MQSFQRIGATIIKNLVIKPRNQSHVVVANRNIFQKHCLLRKFHRCSCLFNEESVSTALRKRKRKSANETSQYFVDMKAVRTVAGNGGNGEIAFLHLFANENGGPAGGNGGNGGHVIFEVSSTVKDLTHITTLVQADHGERGASKDCHGKSAKHTTVKIPVGTVIRSTEGNILADLDEEGMMFIAARGGAGGHGNAFFVSDVNQAPVISEFGAIGEENQYILEVRSMAHIGLIGLPNAGKSTLLRAISRARPKVAPYPFTTLKPHIGMVLYDDYEQIAVADLPGLIEDSHKNRGLGIMFLKHAERCAALLYIIDVSAEEPWEQLNTLQYEIKQFSSGLLQRPALVIANKIDALEAQTNLELLKHKTDIPIVPISAKIGTNLATLLKEIRVLYDKELDKKKTEKSVIENSQ